MSALAADDYPFIAKRLAEIRSEREKCSGVLNNPLPSGVVEETEQPAPNLDAYACYWGSLPTWR